MPRTFSCVSVCTARGHASHWPTPRKSNSGCEAVQSRGWPSSLGEVAKKNRLSSGSRQAKTMRGQGGGHAIVKKLGLDANSLCRAVYVTYHTYHISQHTQPAHRAPAPRGRTEELQRHNPARRQQLLHEQEVATHAAAILHPQHNLAWLHASVSSLGGSVPATTPWTHMIRHPRARYRMLIRQRISMYSP
jgi:hypothetical protein